MSVATIPDALDLMLAEQAREARLARTRKRRVVVKCPQSCPVMDVLGITVGSHTLRFSDSLRPSGMSRPDGAAELQLFVAITDFPDAPVDEARYYGKATRNRLVVNFDEKHDGKIATYYGRW